MRPEAGLQIRWGLGVALAALAVILVLALVPDPLFRQQVYTTTFDDVQALTPGAPVYFHGAEVGSIRSVTLNPANRTFAVGLGVERSWRPSSCSFARIVASNPFTTPRIELAALDAPSATCAAARAAASCISLTAPSAKRPLTGCKRGPDLFETAAAAVAEAAEVAKTANVMVLQLQAMMPKPGASASGVDVQALIKDVTHTLASINEMSSRLNASFAPGKGDIALTLANVRRTSDQAATIDVASVNATIKQLELMMDTNQARVTAMLEDGTAISSDTRRLLENLSTSLSATGNNLQRTTDSLDALSERLSQDPTYLIRGQKFTDPPAPGATK